MNLLEFISSSQCRNEQWTVPDCIEDFGASIVELIWLSAEKPTKLINQNPRYLMGKALACLRSSVTLTCALQPSAAFPILRTGLEAIIYAGAMLKKAGIEDDWFNREFSKEEEKVSRKKMVFSSLAKIACAEHPHLLERIVDSYEIYISYGGHPNPFSLIHHYPEDLEVLDRTFDFYFIEQPDSVLDGWRFVIAAYSDTACLLAHILSGSVSDGELELVKRRIRSGFESAQPYMIDPRRAE